MPSTLRRSPLATLSRHPARWLLSAGLAVPATGLMLATLAITERTPAVSLLRAELRAATHTTTTAAPMQHNATVGAHPPAPHAKPPASHIAAHPATSSTRHLTTSLLPTAPATPALPAQPGPPDAIAGTTAFTQTTPPPADTPGTASSADVPFDTDCPHRVKPEFPSAALNDGITYGEVHLRLTIAPDGGVRSASVLHEEPVGYFAAAARLAAAQFRCRPTTSQRHAVAPFIFKAEIR